MRVRCAPSEPRTRRVSSTMSPRIVSGSRIDVTRAAISRSVRSVSARRAVSSRERPSSRISSALWIAIVARSASAASMDASSSPKWPTSGAKTASVPSTTASPTSGANAIERMPASSKKSRLMAGPSANCGRQRRSRRSRSTRRSRIARNTPSSAALRSCEPVRISSSMPASYAQWISPVAGSRRSMTAPLRPEQPGGLVDDVLEQLRRVLDGHHPAGDLAQRALGVRGPLERGLRRVASRSTSRAFVIAIGGLGRERRDAAGRPPRRTRPRSRWAAWSTPSRPSSPMTGAAMIEWRPTDVTPLSPSG